MRISNKDQTELFLNILNLLESIVAKYESGNYKAGLKGLEIGLKKYIENERFNEKLDLYLVWYIKTAIEYDLGMKNKDTKVWEEMINTKSV